jgi:hypothetical protein
MYTILENLQIKNLLNFHDLIGKENIFDIIYYIFTFF